MATTKITAKLIGKKRFSNKAYTINVRLYEYNMARVEVDSKKRFRGKSNWHGGYIPFDDCITESSYDYVETLERMQVDKGARRWLRKVMRHCVEGLTKPNGNMDWKKVHEKENSLHHYSSIDLKLGVAQLQIIKRYIPELFIAGNYRMDYMKYAHIKKIGAEEDGSLFPFAKIKREAARKHHERRWAGTCFYAPKAELLKLIKELSENFYQQITQERTLNDCSIKMTYSWHHGEKPELGISVSDNTYTYYAMPIE
jgi:hypothetical protein